MLRLFKNLLNKIGISSEDNSQKIQTFTYFIPSPPRRDTGYREKQFDKEFYEFINKGYEIISINTQQSSDINKSGMWFICTVRSKNPESAKLEFLDSFNQFDDGPDFQNSIIHEHEIEEHDPNSFELK